MKTQELKSEQSRISAKIKGLETIASISEDAQLQIEYLKEELRWIEMQLKK